MVLGAVFAKFSVMIDTVGGVETDPKSVLLVTGVAEVKIGLEAEEPNSYCIWYRSNPSLMSPG
tara:strand:- start:428 stop:616 length:189 start_codon:yes stop_codon:yes gene_type:complete